MFIVRKILLISMFSLLAFSSVDAYRDDEIRMALDKLAKCKSELEGITFNQYLESAEAKKMELKNNDHSRQFFEDVRKDELRLWNGWSERLPRLQKDAEKQKGSPEMLAKYDALISPMLEQAAGCQASINQKFK